jgi:hypothetical protein
MFCCAFGVLLVSGRIPLEAVPTVDNDFMMTLSNVVPRLVTAFYL